MTTAAAPDAPTTAPTASADSWRLNDLNPWTPSVHIQPWGRTVSATIRLVRPASPQSDGGSSVETFVEAARAAHGAAHSGTAYEEARRLLDRHAELRQAIAAADRLSADLDARRGAVDAVAADAGPLLVAIDGEAAEASRRRAEAAAALAAVERLLPIHGRVAYAAALAAARAAVESRATSLSEARRELAAELESLASPLLERLRGIDAEIERAVASHAAERTAAAVVREMGLPT